MPWYECKSFDNCKQLIDEAYEYLLCPQCLEAESKESIINPKDAIHIFCSWCGLELSSLECPACDKETGMETYACRECEEQTPIEDGPVCEDCQQDCYI